ncbi:hypothetical protein F-VV57_0149 [Faustovirus]|nr:hypothetical protein F-VV57_0149 [Faustovirus]QJX73416.1 hypothetical protein F-VV63_0150 [Faustovirus]
MEYEKPVIGYFEFPITGESSIYLRLNVHDSFGLRSNAKAVIAIPVGKFNNKSYCIAMKTREDNIMITGGQTSNIPYDTDNGLMLKHGVSISRGMCITFFANGTKYFATCEFVNYVTKEPTTNETFEIIFPYGRNPSILDHIEKCTLGNMLKPSEKPAPSVKPEAPEVHIEAPIPAPTMKTSYKVEFEFKRAKYSGVDCWAVPRGISAAYKISVDAKTANQLSLTLVVKSQLNSSIQRSNVNFYKDEPDTFRLGVGASHFWIVDKDENLVNFDITNIRPE